jgi:tetratricopeptide (TPR) repeat protein
MPPPRQTVAPEVGEAKLNEAVALHQAGRLDEADAIYRFVAEHFPGHPDVFNLRGLIAEARGDTDAAATLFGQAVRLQPNDTAYLFNHALALRGLERFEEVLATYDRAAILAPGSPEAHFNRSVALLDLERPEEALAVCDHALTLRPDWPAALSHRGYVLRRLRRLEESLTSLDHAVALDPDRYESCFNRAVTLQDLRRLDEAMAGFERAIVLRPDAADPRLSRATTLLVQGDFERGWPAYEARWARPLHKAILRDLGRPLWLGQEDLRDKTILLHAEQGLGDTIQFARYATLAAERGARVILEVPRTLVGLMRTLKGPDVVIARGDPIPAFDLQTPLLSLPLAFGTTLDAIPASSAYLAADPQRIARWAQMLGPKTGPRIGLVWSGNPKQGNDRNRSIALADLLAQLPQGPQYVSLQNEVREHDRAALMSGRVRHFGDALQDFTDTAALASHMAMVVSVCTSGAHLGGALGKDTRVMLTNVGTCWRWLTDREDSPWYPSMRLYRQGADNDWRPIFARIAQDIAMIA